MSVPREQIETYIARAEQRFSSDPRPEVSALFALYLQLGERFSTDLGNAREVTLSKAAALMLIQYRAAQLDTLR